MQEGADGGVHLKGLSVREVRVACVPALDQCVRTAPGCRRQARREEDALRLLFIGNRNRMTAETPMNMASSRSHCVFTLAFDVMDGSGGSRRPPRRSCAHFVDLAGSERAHRSEADALSRREGRMINLSLHHLESVRGCPRVVVCVCVFTSTIVRMCAFVGVP